MLGKINIAYSKEFIMHDYGMSGWGIGFGWLVPILFIVLVVYFFKKNTKD